jgi:hypothetical protein
VTSAFSKLCQRELVRAWRSYQVRAMRDMVFFDWVEEIALIAKSLLLTA